MDINKLLSLCYHAERGNKNNPHSNAQGRSRSNALRWNEYSIYINLFITFTIVIIYGSTVSSQPSQVLNTLSANFERKTVLSNSTEITEGTMYYQNENKLTLEINKPIEQIVIFTEDEMLIYYPKEKKAFKLKERQTVASLGLFQKFIGAIKDDYGLGESGYILQKHNKKGDILYTYWQPPEHLKKIFGAAILGKTKNKVASVEIKNPNETTAIKIFYNDHIKFKGIYFPTNIYSETFTGRNVEKEYIKYSNVKFNSPLPDKIVKFKLPGDMKEVKR